MKKETSSKILLVLIAFLTFITYSLNVNAAEVCITYNSMGAPATPATSCAEEGGTVTIAAGPTWDGHRFLGWGQTKGTTYVSNKFKPGSEATINNSVTVYAVWAGTAEAQVGTTSISSCDEFTVKREYFADGSALLSPGMMSAYKTAPLKMGKFNAIDNCSTGKKYESYCIDAGKPAPAYAGSGYVKTDDLDVNSSNATWAKFSKAVVYVYKNAYPTVNIAGFTEEDNYVIATIAVRFLSYEYGLGDTASAHARAYSDTQQMINLDNGVAYKNYIAGAGGGSAIYPTNINTKNMLAKATDLYLAAVAEANNSNSDVNDFNFNFGPITYEDVEYTAVNATRREFNYKTTVKMSLTGLNSFVDDPTSKSTVENIVVDCPTGVTCQLQGYSGGNILDTGDDTFDFTVLVSGSVSGLDAKTIDLKVTVDFYDANDTHNAFMIKSANASINLQRMILFVDATDDAPLNKLGLDDIQIDMCKTVKPMIPDLPEDSDLYEFYYEYCEPFNGCFKVPSLTWGSSEFDEDLFIASCCTQIGQYKETDEDLYDDYLAICSQDCIQTDLPALCDDALTDETGYFAEVSVKEGIDKDTNAINYSKCVINQTDLAGNTYNLANFDAGTNPYCTVSCKEDWEMSLPNRKQKPKAGTYLLMSALVKGTRTCVSSPAIDYPNFNSDVNTLNGEAITAYNNYLYWQAASKAAENPVSPTTLRITSVATERTYSVLDSTPGTRLIVTGTNADGTNITELENFYFCPAGYTRRGSELSSTSFCTKSLTIPQCNTYSLKWTAPQFSYAANTVTPAGNKASTAADEEATKIGGYTTTIDRGYVTAVTCTYPTTPAASAWSTNHTGFKEKVEAYDVQYDEILSQIGTAFNYINACSSWENDFDFEPKIEYTYPENYYMNMVGNNNYFAVNNAGVTTVETSSYCSSASNATSFACTGTQQPGAFGPVNKNYVYCAGTSCTMSNVKSVPTNGSIMKMVTKSGLYKPITKFYTVHSTGDVVTESGTNTSLIETYTTAQSENTKLNGQILPISLTTAGTTPTLKYKYELSISQVGQFNNIASDETTNTNLGRIFGSPNSVYAELVQDSNGIYVFACTYDVIPEACTCCGDYDSIYHRIDVNTGEPYPDNNNVINKEGQIAFSYRPVSLNDLFPNDSGSAGTTNWNNLKGRETLAEIETSGEGAYIDPEYSYIIDPSGTAALKQYNASATSGYANFELNCSDYGRACTSTYLDEIASGNVDGVKELKRKEGFEYYADTSWK